MLLNISGEGLLIDLLSSSVLHSRIRLKYIEWELGIDRNELLRPISPPDPPLSPFANIYWRVKNWDGRI